MKVACVAVVLVSLFVLCAFSAPNCGDNGVQDSYAQKYCNCFSGYAPSDRTQSDCNVGGTCPSREPLDTSTSVGGFKPTLFSTRLYADKYETVIRLPLVVGRRNATVRYQGGENTCGYPGGLWYKAANGLDCVDELRGSMPWSSNGVCGFKKTVQGSKASYSTGLIITYDDYIPSSGSIRTSSVLIRVNVTFTTTTSVIYNLINLNPAATLVSVSVIGSVDYDANTGFGTVSIQTRATWPYQVDKLIMISTPAPLTATVVLDSNFDQTSQCTGTTNSACVQRYVMTISPNTACNLVGLYTFNITLSCRSGACGVNYEAGQYSIRLFNTDICGVNGFDVGLTNGALSPFSDAAGTTPASTFVPNNVVYFAFTLSSSAVTIDSITVEQITAATNGVQDVLYDLHPTSGAAGISTKGSAAGLTITGAVTPAAPGTDATLWFRVQLVDTITSFRVLPSAAAAVTLSIIVNIEYHGNSKRTIEAVLTPTTVTSSSGMADIYISGTDENISGGDYVIPNSASSLGSNSVAFLVLLLVLMLVFNF